MTALDASTLPSKLCRHLLDRRQVTLEGYVSGHDVLHSGLQFTSLLHDSANARALPSCCKMVDHTQQLY